MFYVICLSFRENALGGALNAIPWFKRVKQYREPSWPSKPGSARRTTALPGGKVKQTVHYCSPVPAAGSA